MKIVNVLIDDVVRPRHLSAKVTGIDKTGKDVPNAIMTVYTGVLGVGLATTLAIGDRFLVHSFVPINVDDPNDPGVIDKQLIDYSSSTAKLIDAVATATVSTFADSDIELIAVESVSIDVVPITFPVSGQSHRVLLLTVEINLNDGKVHGITYHVTTLSLFGEKPGIIPISGFATIKPDPLEHPNFS